MSLQEKFQIVTPYSQKHDDDGDKWVDFKSQRCVEGTQWKNNEGAASDASLKLNIMPPGMDINDQPDRRIENMPRSLGGQTDVSADVEPSSMREGFKRLNMSGADDQYTGEHVDLFYGEAVDEKGQVGFAERNNYLDRL